MPHLFASSFAREVFGWRAGGREKRLARESPPEVVGPTGADSSRQAPPGLFLCLPGYLRALTATLRRLVIERRTRRGD